MTGVPSSNVAKYDLGSTVVYAPSDGFMPLQLAFRAWCMTAAPFYVSPAL